MKVVFALLLIVSVLFGCHQQTPVPEEPTTQATEALSQEIYTASLDALMSEANTCMNVVIESSMRVHGETFRTKQTKEIRYSPSAAQITTVVDYGEYMLTTSEICIDNTVFLSVNNEKYQSAMTLQEFLLQQIPKDMLHAQLYDTVVVSPQGNEVHIQFTQPVAAESWAIPQSAQMLNASGFAVLSADKKLASAEYEICYQIENAQVQNRVTANYASFTESIGKPAGEYIPVEYVHGPLLAEQAYGYLLQTSKTDCQIKKEVFSQANSTKYTNAVTVHRAPEEYTVTTTTSLSDPSLGLESQEQIQVEQFKNGIYSITLNGEPIDSRPGIDSQNMGRYCLDLLTGNMVSSKYFTSSCLEIIDAKQVLTFHGSDALSQVLCQEGCKILYRDETFLDSQTDHFEDYQAVFQLTLDPVTGLPDHCQIHFYGIHHINGINYILESTYSQTFLYEAKDAAQIP